MSYLIDTQILFWLFIKTRTIPKNVLHILENIDNEIFFSKVTIWELAIKISISKIILPFELKNITQEIAEINFNILDIKSEHLIKVAELPFHHKDPFDRLIISQAIIENIPIVSSDNDFKKYGVEIIW